MLAVTLSGPAHLGLYGITIAGAAALILKNVVFTPLYVSYITNHKNMCFIKERSRRFQQPCLPGLFVRRFSFSIRLTAGHH